MRTALHSVIKEGREADYDRVHAEIWPEMVQTLDRAGISDWHIWRSGRQLFHMVESEDFERAMSLLAADAVNQRWQDFINEIVDHFEPGDGSGALPLVWSLRRQAADEPDNGEPR